MAEAGGIGGKLRERSGKRQEKNGQSKPKIYNAFQAQACDPKNVHVRQIGFEDVVDLKECTSSKRIEMLFGYFS